MRVLIISLTNSLNTGSRELQFASVVKALNNSDINTTIITIKNEKIDHANMNRVICLPCNGKSSQTLIGMMQIKVEKIFTYLLPYMTRSIKGCVDSAIQIIDEEKPDCILTSSNPVISHVAGLLIKKKRGLPWIASFSDPRPFSILPSPYDKNDTYLQANFQKDWIAKVLKLCDAVHMPSKYGINLTEKNYGIIIKNKSHIIPHVGSSRPLSKSLEFKGWLVHTGNLTNLRVSDAFLRAIRDAHNQIPDKFKGLICVGHVSPQFINIIKELKMEKIVILKGFKSQEEASSIANNASAVVVIEAEMEFSPFLPSKFADYAIFQRPILAITPQISAVRDYLDQFGVGVAVTHNNNEIIKGIMTIFSNENISKQGNSISEENLSKLFSSKEVGLQYKKMLLKIVSS